MSVWVTESLFFSSYQKQQEQQQQQQSIYPIFWVSYMNSFIISYTFLKF